MTSPKVTKIPFGTMKTVVFMFFTSRPIIFHPVSWLKIKVIHMFPYDEAVGEWMNEIFINSLKSEIQKLQKWKVKTVQNEKIISRNTQQNSTLC